HRGSFSSGLVRGLAVALAGQPLVVRGRHLFLQAHSGVELAERAPAVKLQILRDFHVQGSHPNALLLLWPAPALRLGLVGHVATSPCDCAGGLLPLCGYCSYKSGALCTSLIVYTFAW